MADDKNEFWFYAKSFGWGWSFPARWQGWAVFTVYIVLLLGVRLLPSMSGYRMPYVIGVSIILVLIIMWKGERPLRWRWGDD